MFVGHFGIGFGGKAVAPRAALGTLMRSAPFVDLLWPMLLVSRARRVDRHRTLFAATTATAVPA